MVRKKSSKIEQEILRRLNENTEVRQKDLLSSFGDFRPLMAYVFRRLLKAGKILKVGSTRGAYYILNTEKNRKSLEKKVNRLKKTYKKTELEEHVIFDEFKAGIPRLNVLHENIQCIFFYAFTEMVNNAIEHSRSDRIDILVEVIDNKLRFEVRDFGIGIFRNVRKQRKLKDVYEAAAELMKGKTTTAPKAHSGEGVFFTSKAADVYLLDSYGLILNIDNTLPDLFLRDSRSLRGTRVIFEISLHSNRHLARDVFGPYTTNAEDLAFDKTKIRIKLYKHGTAQMSRSQARRIITGLEKFKAVIFGFDKIPYIGQACADEMFRAFVDRHPAIIIQIENANRAVQIMIERVRER